MKLSVTTSLFIAAVCFVMPARNAVANNLAVTNVSLASGGDGYTYVQFDLSWDNSWRLSWTEGSVITNWDAAWVFIKYRVGGGTWEHATLATNGHTAPTGSTIDVGVTASIGKGAFIYRSEVGAGTNIFDEVKLRWNYGDDGVSTTQSIDIAVFADEMVYITEGSFELGSGGAETAHFYEYPTATVTYTVSSEGAILTATNNGSLWGLNGIPNIGGNNAVSPSTSNEIPAAFPKGYAAFYCMKYSITQDQYTKFLNHLTEVQGTNRYPNFAANRYTIGGNWPNYTNAAPDRGCNYLSWADGAAYADWAALRPMTELEYEKTCRGAKPPVANEYAWGTAVIVQQTNHFAGGGTDGSGTETAAPTNANCSYGGKIDGPVRAGIYATSNSTREASGSGYYGVMQMSGNLRERPVTVGNAAGRTFTGNHGDGTLDSDGDANVALWPGTDAVGAGCRRGSHADAANATSSRDYAAFTAAARDYYRGWRGVRTAP